ncbi:MULTISPECIES: glycoside hydrolase family protein [Rhodopirellula]|jgi:beta-fructofuranosidase|uniref:Glycosyl hydrolase family 32 protein n=1 Tax=Rhodopirellula europaea SH398 TaxID=1263868 RepID=M5RVW8_9BACT|nr:MULTISPECIES: glycosyl hydrolase family 32 protein [Rhodopirellula]EMI23321.1 glycosyl hydrolase family 32 protein [Rhodopirellula europaea SH398]MCR9207276.1 glycosyl hydrolase [bacterium]|tara:strand:+ start:7990 stop:9549 length:1560 start_codon:yes stop_codon:yes gene_type:complete
MYSETAGTRKTLGDVDILYHDGIYHLFHLVLPNHDFIAHAVSNNCFSWRRVENALFIGDPGSWDDSMLWTMHVSPNPHRPGSWRMFYTGLSRRDHGAKQRLGMAESDDLYCWTKAPVAWEDRRSALPYDLPGRPPQPPFKQDMKSCFPLSPDREHYESEIDEARNWVSWRDPYYYHENGRGWLLAAGRVNHGPIVRRGCVAVMEEVQPNKFEQRPPLHHPGLYDDIEVPNLFKINGDYYLVGSMREDAKIRYWHTEKIGKPWRTYADNVLLASGNYAGRITTDDKGILLWSFFTPGGADRQTGNLMPPPKRICRLPNGQLEVRTFEGFDSLVESEVPVEKLSPIKPVECQSARTSNDNSFDLDCESGFQCFALEEDLSCFRLRCHMKMMVEGKCGVAFRLDRESHDGYYLSLDLFKGVAQLRAWGSGPDGSGEETMQFQSLQAGYWEREVRGEVELQLIAYGSYIEVSVGGHVLLSLADQTFNHGALGFNLESGNLRVTNVQVERFIPPVQSDEHLANG